jgi:hypothetical protein
MPSKKNQRSYSNRQEKVQINNTRQRILIVCEGTKTEPNYFEGLRREFKNKVHIDIKPAGRVHLSLVKYAKKLADEDGEYNEVWCVFDRDLKTENQNQENFNQAIITAQQNQFKLAISNDAFELWYILHYEHYCSATHRQKYDEILSDKNRLGKKYLKNSNEMYLILKPLQQQGIINAKKLWEKSEEEVISSQQETDQLIKKHNINPSTTVYQLIERIQEIVKSN